MRYSALKYILAAIACLSVVSLAAIPELRITTQNNAQPQSQNGGSCGNSGGGGWWWAGGITSQTYKFPYVTVTGFQLTDPNNPANNLTRNSTLDSIRLRGNSTSGVAKKPYRIKFGQKQSLFGKEEAKSWVLLANFYDGTFALNAMAFDLGKSLELKFTPTYQFVDLYINNEYKGIYQLTEQIQSNPGRVDIRNKHNGWLVEFDYHSPASDECLSWFTTGSNRYNLTTFVKAPELEEMVNPTDSTQIRFVRNDILALVNKMSESGFPNNGYRDLIDLESFAKYVLIQLVMDNFDFNSKVQQGALPGSNFAYKIDSCSRIQAGPLWDFDLAAGVTQAGFPAHYRTYQDPIIPTHPFYQRLWEDPVFKAKYKKAWDQYKNNFNAMGNFIDNISNTVSGSVTGKGNNTWSNNSMMGNGTLTQQQFSTEISSLKTWWTNRLNYVEQQLRNIDTSADIVQPIIGCKTVSSSSGNSSSSSSSSRRSSSSSRATTPILSKIAVINQVAQTSSGINLHAINGAMVEIYGIRGGLINRQNYPAGVYPVSFANLPKGMYIVRVSFGREVKMLRVPVM